jgi:hypothetical protein
MVDLQTVTLLVQIIGVSATAIAAVIGVSNYIKSNKRAEEARKRDLETRQAQLFMQIQDKITSQAYLENLFEFLSADWKTPEDYKKMYGFNTKTEAKVSSVGYPLESIGVLVKKGLIDVSLVDDLMSWIIISFYERYLPVLDEDRKINPASGEWVEFLYNEVKAIRDKQHPGLKSVLQ